MEYEVEKAVLPEKVVYGVAAITTNANEMTPDTGKIPALWQQFKHQVKVDFKQGERLYGVYSQYESDIHGEFTVLAGSDKPMEGLSKVVVPEDLYLCFKAVASEPTDSERVSTVIGLWGQVWQYFSQDNMADQRAYQVDFEHYASPTEVCVYISIV